MSLPGDLQAIVDELNRLSKSFADLVLPLSPQQFHWQPQPGRAWSIGQCVDHLRLSNRVYVGALAAAAEKGRQVGRTRRDPLRPNPLGRWFLWMIEPPSRLRVPVPLPEMVPASTGDPAALWTGFLDSQSEVVEVLRASSDLDLCRIRFRNPVARDLPVFNLATGFLIVAAHERRHLAQARRVRALAGFPAS